MYALCLIILLLQFMRIPALRLCSAAWLPMKTCATSLMEESASPLEGICQAGIELRGGSGSGHGAMI